MHACNLYIAQLCFRLTIIVHVGTQNYEYIWTGTATIITIITIINYYYYYQAAHAEDIGAVAIGVMPTTFFKPESVG